MPSLQLHLRAMSQWSRSQKKAKEEAVAEAKEAQAAAEQIAAAVELLHAHVQSSPEALNGRHLELVNKQSAALIVAD